MRARLGDHGGIVFYTADEVKPTGTEVFDADFDVGEPWLTSYLEAQGRLVGVGYHRERPVFRIFDKRVARIQKEFDRRYPTSTNQFVGYSPAFDAFFFVSSGPTDSGTLRVCSNFQIARLSTLRPHLTNMPLAEMKPIRFPAADGTTLHGYLSMPPGCPEGRRVPLVVLIHGGPWVRDIWQFDEAVQYYAALGYGVLQVNYRGSTGYGLSYGLDGDLLRIARQAPGDVVDGIKWAIAQGYADGDKVAVVGTSFGAFLSTVVACDYPEIPSCVVGFAGVYDLKLMVEKDIEYRRRWTSSYKEFEGNEEELYEVSPVARAAGVKAPMLLVHGNFDRRVGLEQVDAMEEALDKAGATVRVVKEQYLTHGLRHTADAVEHYTRVAKFLREHLGRGYEGAE